MFFYKWFSSPNDRRLAREEAEAAIVKYGDKAANVLVSKGRQTQSAQRRKIYRLARYYLSTGPAVSKAPHNH